MLKLSSISFTGAGLSIFFINLYFMFVCLMLSSDINVNNMAFTPYCGVVLCVGGDYDVKAIQSDATKDRECKS